MEAARSLWTRYGDGYALVNRSSATNFSNSSQSSFPASSRDSRGRGYSSSASNTTTVKSFESRPIISWRTEPNLELAVDFRGLGRLIAPLLLALLPSFIRSSKNKKPNKLFPTSYLDGLRGVAAFFVVIHHYTVQYTVNSSNGYGYEKKVKGQEDWFFQLPMIRLVHSGRFMVVIFFILSGYVLSHRSLKLARQGKHLELLESLASSVFRRWLRLHLPVAASCFLGFILARWNLWGHMPKGWEHNPSGRSWIQSQPVPFPTSNGSFFHQFNDLYGDVKQLTNPFLFGRVAVSRYSIGVLWTIPVEWMGSMITFVTVLGICRTKTWIKLSILFLLYYRSHQIVRWEWACFFAGIFLAELSFIWARPLDAQIPTSGEKETPLTPFERYAPKASKVFFVFLFFLGIYLGSQPRHGWWDTPGYKWLFRNLPKQYADAPDRGTFWPSVGGIFLIFSLEMLPSLQSIFTTPFALYLGKISFSLYVIHIQILYTLGEWLTPKCMNVTGGWSNGILGFAGGVFLSVLVMAPVTFWAADVFTRLVDEKSVKLARWVSDKAFIRS